MQRTLDFNTVWADTTTLLRRHQEAIIAIAGMLIFLPAWAKAFFIPPPNLEGLVSPAAVLDALGQNMIDHWIINLPLTIIGFFGGLAVVCIMLRTEMERVGDAILFALKILPIYFIVSLLVGLLTGFGVLAFFIGLFYLAGRFLPVGPVIVAQPEKGILGSITHGWELTRGLGWKCFLLFFIVFLIGSISAGVLNLIIGIACRLVMGPEGLPFVESFVLALGSTVIAVVMLALEAAVFLHLQRQNITSVPHG
jgi:hypothetical protein